MWAIRRFSQKGAELIGVIMLSPEGNWDGLAIPEIPFSVPDASIRRLASLKSFQLWRAASLLPG